MKTVMKTRVILPVWSIDIFQQKARKTLNNNKFLRRNNNEIMTRAIGDFNINKQTCMSHVFVGKRFDYSRKTYRNGCSLAYIFTHLRSVKTHKNALVAFRIIPTPSVITSNNLAGLNCFYGIVFQGEF